MNINPSLAVALALAHAERSQTLSDYDRKYAELRVYPGDAGEGCFFVSARAPIRWYWRDAPKSDHFNAADTNVLMDVILEGAHVQLTGDRGRNLTLWMNWEDFENEVN
jgi:hypothetical protein